MQHCIKNLSEETKTEYSQASIRNMECTEKEKAKKENISGMFEGLKGAMDDPGLQTSA